MLRVTQLVGFGGNSRSMTRTLTTSLLDSTNTTLFTFASAGIGTETSDRFIAACVEMTFGVAGATVSSVNIGGVTAVLGVTAGVAGGTKDIWYTPKLADGGPSGTTATIVVTGTGPPAPLNCGVEVYALTGSGSVTPTATASDTSAPLSVSINVSGGGVVLAGGRGAGTPGAASWTGLTQDVDGSLDAGVVKSTSASNEFPTGTSALTVSLSFAAGTPTSLAVAAWGP